MANELKGKIDGLILDMDGVLYRGNQALPGAADLFPALREAGLSFILLTNNSTLTQQEFSLKLARMGITVEPDSVVTSATATALYLMQHYPDGGGVYVVGESGLLTTVTGIPGFYADSRQPKFVVVGLHYHFTYEVMQRACTAIRNGAHFIATNADTTIPLEGGELWPGAGSILASVQTCSGIEPTIIGKPNPYIGEMALLKLGLPANRVLCVGDRIETDIALGKAINTPTALVTTGVAGQGDVRQPGVTPDHTFTNLPALMQSLGLTTNN